MREIYATRCASAVLAHVRSVFSGAAEITFINSSIYFPDVPESTVDLGSYEEFVKRNRDEVRRAIREELHKGQKLNGSWEAEMSFHFLVYFEPLPGMESDFRE